jgi:CheY-like chemotaxis protein
MTTQQPALILIVDDDYDFLEISRMILEKAGYRVALAAEPRQALVRMGEEKPDLVITDLMMTSLDSGFFFARTIKEDPRYADVPVIIATSVSSALGLDFRPRTEEDRGQMHVDAYFDKPLDTGRLLSTVSELLGRTTAPAESVGTPETAPSATPEPKAPSSVRATADADAPDGSSEY